MSAGKHMALQVVGYLPSLHHQVSCAVADPVPGACDCGAGHAVPLVRAADAWKVEAQRDELLAAARQAEKWIAQRMLELGWPQERLDSPPEGSHLFNLRAAIAKAGGQS